MALKFSSEVVTDKQNRIPYKIFHTGGREHYNLRIWLDGPAQELDEVASVDYVLHPSFRDRHRMAFQREGGFGISFWTWGMFAIQATINYKNGQKEQQEFYLSYDLPEDDESNYVLLPE